MWRPKSLALLPLNVKWLNFKALYIMNHVLKKCKYQFKQTKMENGSDVKKSYIQRLKLLNLQG